MAHLTKPNRYNIADSNIALLGSDLEHHVREHAGDAEHAWVDAGQSEGIQIWRIEKFQVKDWQSEKKGTFYSGDSYIVLHTYRKTPDAEKLSYDLHFWLGDDTSQDEAGTAAYKTVELDDHLHGVATQYREAQGFESARFLSYFPHFTCLRGGVDTGFHHVEEAKEDDTPHLYHVSRAPSSRPGAASKVIVREEGVSPATLNRANVEGEGDAFVLVRGRQVWQLNMKGSSGKEKFGAADLVRRIADARKGRAEVRVFEEGAGAGVFSSTLEELAGEDVSRAADQAMRTTRKPSLVRISDSSGIVSFAPVELSRSSLASLDAFILDEGSRAVYAWIGNQASATESKMALHHAQKYLWQCDGANPRCAIVRVREGDEPSDFWDAL